jgi:hypothetical protein
MDALRFAIVQWLDQKQKLESIKAEEKHTRMYIVAQCFPKLDEGVNNSAVGKFKIKAKKYVNRDVSEAMLTTYAAEFRKLGINVDALIRTHPELNLKEYRNLPDKKRHEFDRALTISDGSVQLEVTTE